MRDVRCVMCDARCAMCDARCAMHGSGRYTSQTLETSPAHQQTTTYMAYLLARQRGTQAFPPTSLPLAYSAGRLPCSPWLGVPVMASFPSEVQPSQAHPDPNTPAAVVANWAFISSIDPNASSIAFASCYEVFFLLFFSVAKGCT